MDEPAVRKSKRNRKRKAPDVKEESSEHHEVEEQVFGSLKDMSEAYQDKQYHILRKQLHKDGFLFLRSFFTKEEVLTARCHILAEMSMFCDSSEALMDGYISPELTEEETPQLMSRQSISRLPAVHSILESPKLTALFRVLRELDAKEEVQFCRFKWLRAVGRGKFTGVHMDKVYVGDSSPNLLTAWIPFGTVTREQGALVVCPGSHVDARLAELRDGYGRSRVGQDGTSSGWLGVDGSSLNKYGDFQWQSGTFEPGDVMVFGPLLVHQTLPNTTNRFRISCDVRMQEASVPLDERLQT